MQSISKQLETNAIAAYVHYGVRIALPLSAPARRELQRIRKTYAGLHELACTMQMQRLPFETNQDFGARLLHARSVAYNAQRAREIAQDVQLAASA